MDAMELIREGYSSKYSRRITLRPFGRKVSETCSLIPASESVTNRGQKVRRNKYKDIMNTDTTVPDRITTYFFILLLSFYKEVLKKYILLSL